MDVLNLCCADDRHKSFILQLEHVYVHFHSPFVPVQHHVDAFATPLHIRFEYVQR